MEERVFSITELVRNAEGVYTPTPVSFRWTAANRSIPRGSWHFGMKLRTVREEYTGGGVSEQVLGYAYKPFTVSGVWDDRYNGDESNVRSKQASLFAERTWQAFERLLQRGNLVRIEFESITVTGLIVDVDFDYKHRSKIGYSFQVSPHFRYENQSTDALTPPAPIDPDTMAKNARVIVDEAQRLMTEEAPNLQMKGDLFETITATVTDWAAKVAIVEDIVNTRVLSVSQSAVDGLSKMAHTLASLRGSAISLLNTITSQASTANLAFETAINTLDFEVWARDLAYQARLMILESARAQEELESRVTPKAIALYRPHKDENLYAISQMFYQTPHRWRDIQLANGLTAFTLTGNELLVIPEVK